MLFQRLKVFLIILVLVALFNVVLCYDYEIADLHLDELAYQFGWELLCFLKVSACFAILCCICQNRIGDLFDKVNRYFLFIYGTAWVISTFIAPEHYWEVIEIFDNIVIALCLLGAVACLIEPQQDRGALRCLGRAPERTFLQHRCCDTWTGHYRE